VSHLFNWLRKKFGKQEKPLSPDQISAIELKLIWKGEKEISYSVTVEPDEKESFFINPNFLDEDIVNDVAMMIQELMAMKMLIVVSDNE
jgi:hypothetical protein